ncbi:IS3 family transposase [Noviherbaspirillum sp.]|uniref:IS3 family transposase n=1 Tax=Noviherbaspirillum sp. TaxID=1926288 RepID=UPI0039C920EF
MLALIHALHAHFRQAHGLLRITEGLKSKNIRASRDRIRRWMKSIGIRTKNKRRCKAVIDSKHAGAVTPHLSG